MKLETEKSFLRSLRRRSDAELQQVTLVMQQAAGSFGQPHSHAGVGIRRLGRNLFECRVGLDLRLLFKAGPGTLTFVFSGNHDDIQAFLRK
jgi:mRNA-degrading endonuclease YafQ of YafQ-DinJ toxin-antitoxin module